MKTMRLLAAVLCVLVVCLILPGVDAQAVGEGGSPDGDLFQQSRAGLNLERGLGASIFADGFETGNTSQWSLVVGEQAVPFLSAQLTAPDEITLTWTFAWSCCLGSSNDGYQLEQSTTSGTSGFSSIFNSSGTGDRVSPKVVSYTRSPGTYWHRVRANDGGWSPFSNVVQTTVTVAPPVTTTVLPAFDNLLLFSTVNANLANTVYDIGNFNSVGCNFSVLLYSTEWVCGSSALYFDINSLIAGKTVLSATLKLWPANLPADLATTYAATAFASGWSTSTITWNNEPNYYTSFPAVVSPPVTTAVPVEFNVTNIVQTWANGGWVNNGFLVRDTVSVLPGSSVVRSTDFSAVNWWIALNQRPVLVVTLQ